MSEAFAPSTDTPFIGPEAAVLAEPRRIEPSADRPTRSAHALTRVATLAPPPHQADKVVLTLDGSGARSSHLI